MFYNFKEFISNWNIEDAVIEFKQIMNGRFLSVFYNLFKNQIICRSSTFCFSCYFEDIY